MKRYDIINNLIADRGYKSYLEIGLDNPFLNFIHINCELKESVDPYDLSSRICTSWNDSNLEAYLKFLTYRKTSDEFFRAYPYKKYDIIFIDGLHLEEQCDRDVRNSLSHINKKGIVVVHDCLPINETMQCVPAPSNGPWMGTVWKTMVKYTQYTHLDIKIIAIDTGIGLIEYTDNLEFAIPEKLDMEYSYFKENIFTLLNVYEI